MILKEQPLVLESEVFIYYENAHKIKMITYAMRTAAIVGLIVDQRCSKSQRIVYISRLADPPSCERSFQNIRPDSNQRGESWLQLRRYS